MTEEQMWQMSPRSFHNILQGRKYKLQAEKAEWEQRHVMHQELVLAVLSPHLKKADRDKAYRDLENMVNKGKQKPKEKGKKKDPIKFWDDIDKRACSAKEPPIPEG